MPGSAVTDSATPGRRRGATRLAVAALALLAAYALPLLWPPPAAEPGAALGAPGWIERLFPGVPAAWVTLRLGALALGAALAAASAPTGFLRWPARASEALPPPSAPRQRVALALAAALALCALAADRLSAPLQQLFLLGLAAPPLVLFAAFRPVTRPASRGPAVAVAGVLAVWALSGAFLWPHSPRAANAVDVWLGVQFLMSAAASGRNLLTEGALPGMSSVPLFFQGVSWLDPANPLPSFGTLVALNALWLLVSALAVQSLAARLVSPWAAPVAVATLLFSPYLQFFPLGPTAFFQGPLYTSLLLAAAMRVHVHRSGAALVAVGALGGLALVNPANAPLAVAVVAGAALSAGAAPRLPLPVCAAAALVLLAAMLPQAPDVATLGRMVDEYAATQGSWLELEQVMFGQRTPFDVPELWQAGRREPFDVPLGALLSPFAAPRSAIRLWGDALLDPVGAALAGVGLAYAVRRARREPAAAALLALLALAIVPAFTSSYDRPSHTRAYCAPVVLALLSAVGFEALRAALVGRAQLALAATLTTIAVAGGGLLLFHVVNPRILPASALGLAVELANRARPSGGYAMLEHGGPHDLSWLQVRTIALILPREPLPVRSFQDDTSLRRIGGGEPLAEVLLFTPALDADQGVSDTVCRAWPAAALYTFVDRTGRTRLRAARPAGPGWTPPWDPARWSTEPCPGARRDP